jgi:hypothetical protein
MVWFFNFCSPHLTDDASVNLNRTIMMVEIIVAMLMTFIVHMLAELYDEEASRVKSEADPPELPNNTKPNEAEESAAELRRTPAQNDMSPGDDVSLKGSRSKVSHFVTKGSRGAEPGFFKSRKVFFLSV